MFPCSEKQGMGFRDKGLPGLLGSFEDMGVLKWIRYNPEMRLQWCVKTFHDNPNLALSCEATGAPRCGSYAHSLHQNVCIVSYEALQSEHKS